MDAIPEIREITRFLLHLQPGNRKILCSFMQ